MENLNTLAPKNVMQELWEMNGRIKALLALAKTCRYIDNKEIIAMLGGEAAEEDAGTKGLDEAGKEGPADECEKAF